MPPMSPSTVVSTLAAAPIVCSYKCGSKYLVCSSARTRRGSV